MKGVLSPRTAMTIHHREQTKVTASHAVQTPSFLYIEHPLYFVFVKLPSISTKNRVSKKPRIYKYDYRNSYILRRWISDSKVVI